MKSLLFLVVLAGLGCAESRQPLPGLMRLVVEPAGQAFDLVLYPATGARINARLKPTIELKGGGRLTLDSPSMTSDSAYFAAPPRVRLARGQGRIDGTLRVGMCPPGLNACQALAVPVSEPVPAT
jgi:hypothetical protein